MSLDYLHDVVIYSSSAVVALSLGLAVLLVLLIVRPKNTREPPQLQDTIPYVSNTIQFLTDAGGFLDRVVKTLHSTQSNIIKFYIGLTPAYIVTGTKNVQQVLGSPETLDGNWIQLTLMDKHWGLTPDEINKFANDKSGRSKTPAPGTEHTAEDQRYWMGHDILYSEYLSNRKCSDALADSFYRLFSERLDRQPTTEWATVQLFDLLKDIMAESAVISLFGSKIIELNPGFIECYWKFDEVAGSLGLGLPKFLQRQAVKTKNRLHAMTRKHIDSAWEHFNWEGQEAQSDWDPHFGSRLSRETARWLRKGGFTNQAAAGHTLASLFGLNGNTVPITTWAMIELIKDPSLFQSVRGEALSTYTADTGEPRIDVQKLVNLPLMQSLYIEILRMHVSFNVTRKATRPIMIDGYPIEEGALVQTCSEMAHFEESVWGVEGHPASEFWAWRHIKYVDSVDQATGERVRQPQFAMKGRPSSFFPYGGGYVMCPGRHFAKQEIMLAIAILITKFDIEFVEWTGYNGVKSHKAPENDRKFAGFVAMPPNRDVKVRWKRLN